MSTLGIESIARPIIETDLLASAVVIAFSNYHTVAAAVSEASRSLSGLAAIRPNRPAAHITAAHGPRPLPGRPRYGENGLSDSR